MSCARALPQKQLQLYADTTSNRRLWLTAWLPAIAVTQLGAMLNMQSRTGAFRVRMRYQVAPVRPEVTSPSTAAFGAWASANGFYSYQTSVSVTDNLLIRFGVEYGLSSASPGGALVTVQPTVVQCGRILGGDSVLVHPGTMTSTDANYFPITPWSPILGLSNVGAGVIVADNESDYLEWALAARSAVDPEAPNAWQLLTGWQNPTTSNEEAYTGVLDPSALNPATNGYFQTGLAARKRSGGGNPRATLSATVAVRT